jgi:hypothetical protein
MPGWEFVEVIPGGNWGLAVLGLLAVPAVRNRLRQIAGIVVRGVLALIGQVTWIVIETRENAEDLVEEVRHGSAPPPA